MYIYIYTCIHIYAYVSLYIYIHTCAYVFMNTYMHAVITGKESMNLKENEEGYIGSLGGRK